MRETLLSSAVRALRIAAARARPSDRPRSLSRRCPAHPCRPGRGGTRGRPGDRCAHADSRPSGSVAAEGQSTATGGAVRLTTTRQRWTATAVTSVDGQATATDGAEAAHHRASVRARGRSSGADREDRAKASADGIGRRHQDHREPKATPLAGWSTAVTRGGHRGRREATGGRTRRRRAVGRPCLPAWPPCAAASLPSPRVWPPSQPAWPPLTC